MRLWTVSLRTCASKRLAVLAVLALQRAPDYVSRYYRLVFVT